MRPDGVFQYGLAPRSLTIAQVRCVYISMSLARPSDSMLRICEHLDYWMQLPLNCYFDAVVNDVTLACIATSALVDLAVIVLTWHRHTPINRLGCVSRTSLADILLREGVLGTFPKELYFMDLNPHSGALYFLYVQVVQHSLRR